MADQGMIVQKNNYQEETDQDHDTPFRFLDLPIDIRRIIYDNVSVQYPRDIPIDVKGYSYAVGSPPVSLLKVNKQINSEATSSLADGRSDQLPVIFCRPWGTCLDKGTLDFFLRTLALAGEYDAHYIQTLPKGQDAELELSRWTLKVPVVRFKKLMAFLYDNKNAHIAINNHTGSLPLVLPPPNIDTEAFNIFLKRVLLQVRRKQTIELRILVGAGFQDNHQFDPGASDSKDRFLDNLGKSQWRKLHLAPLEYRIVVVSENAEAQAQLKRDRKSLVGLVEWEVATPVDRKVMASEYPGVQTWIDEYIT